MSEQSHLYNRRYRCSTFSSQEWQSLESAGKLEALKRAADVLANPARGRASTSLQRELQH